jgi:hypothetical protein
MPQGFRKPTVVLIPRPVRMGKFAMFWWGVRMDG